MEEFNDTPAGRRFYLETLIRQQDKWVIEGGGINAELINRRRGKLGTLKAELGVTDEQTFLREQAASRGES